MIFSLQHDIFARSLRGERHNSMNTKAPQYFKHLELNISPQFYLLLKLWELITNQIILACNLVVI